MFPFEDAIMCMNSFIFTDKTDQRQVRNTIPLVEFYMFITWLYRVFLHNFIALLNISNGVMTKDCKFIKLLLVRHCHINPVLLLLCGLLGYLYDSKLSRTAEVMQYLC